MKKNIKNEILLKSWDIFSGNNFWNLSMSDIAKELEIQKSLLYYYFHNKSDLFYEVIHNNVQNFFAKFEIIFISKKNPRKKIHALSKLYLNQLKNKSSLISTSDKKLDKNIFDLIDETEEKIICCFEQIFSEGMQKGEFKKSDPKNLSIALLGYLDKIKINHIKTNENNWLDFLYK